VIKIDNLIIVSVIQLIKYKLNDAHRKIRLFKLKIIHEIKNKTNALYEQSYLII